MYKEILPIYVSIRMVVFTEIEQEEIMNEFLNKIYTNDMLNIFDKRVADCYCKLNDEKVELSKLNLSSNIINNMCKFNYEECEQVSEKEKNGS